MNQSNQIKKFIIIPLVIVSLVVFNSLNFSVLAEEGSVDNNQSEEVAGGDENGGEEMTDGGITDQEGGTENDQDNSNGADTEDDSGSSQEVIETGDAEVVVEGNNSVNSNVLPEDEPENEEGETEDETGDEIESEGGEEAGEELGDEPEGESEDDSGSSQEESQEEGQEENDNDSGESEEEIEAEESEDNVEESEDNIEEDNVEESEDNVEESEEEGDDEAEERTEIVSENEAGVENDISVVAETGDNSINNSGDSLIDTGDANLVVGLLNTVNSNLLASDFSQFLLNIFESLEGDVNLSEEIGDFSENEEGCLAETDCLNIVDSNQGSIENNVLIDASTGDNSMESNQGEAIINTGNANVVANLFNILNSNVIGSNWFQFIINIFDDWAGDLILPGKETIQDFVEQESSTCGGNCESTNVVSSNEGAIENDVYVFTNTGQNTINRTSGAGTINSGHANVRSNVLNVANSNIAGRNWFFMAVNNFGSWEGNVCSLPPGLTINEDSEGIKVYNLTLDDLNGNSSGGSALNIVHDNSGYIKNSIAINVSTGGNSISGSGGSAVINTGDANVLTNLINILNSNVSSSNWLLGMINVFGNWQGDVAFGRPDLWLGESAVTSSNPAEPGGTVTYTLTYTNNGDADATGVTIIDDFDERYLSVTDPGGGTVIDNPGEIEWDIGTVPVGGSGTVSYSAVIDPEVPYGTSYLVNQATIDSAEADWNDGDNTDTLSVEVYRERPLSTPIGFGYLFLPDIRIKKTSNVEDFVLAGSNVDYRITLINRGKGSAYDVVVYDNLFNESGELINSSSWYLGEVFPYEEINIDYTVAIGSEVPAGFYTNTAWLTGTQARGRPLNFPKASTTIEVRAVETEEIEDLIELEDEEETETSREEGNEEKISLEEIKEELNQIEDKIEKIKEAVARKRGSVPPASPVEEESPTPAPTGLIPEVLAQEITQETELPGVFQEEPENNEETDSGQSFASMLLANIGKIKFSWLWLFLLLLAILFSIFVGNRLSRKKKNF